MGCWCVPRVTWDAAAFETYYQGSDGVNGYGQRMNRDAIFGKRFRVLTTEFNMLPTDRILVVGCGFGYLIDRFHDGGFPNVWGIDSSDDIEQRQGAESRGSTLWVPDTITGAGRIRNKLRQLTGDDEFDWIITESMLESYEDGEVQTILNVCEGALTGSDQSHIIHIVVTKEDPAAPGYAPAFNWKTIADWNLLRPSHSWTGPDARWVIH